MSFTYATLKTALQDYTENDETTFVTHLPDFIRLAEERILKAAQLNVFQKNVSGNMTSSNQYLACPSDFLSPFSLSFVNSSSEKVFLDYKDVNFVQTFNPNSSTTGDPRYYALFDTDNFVIGPTPSASSNVELNYYYRPTSLTAGSDSGTTWLSTNAPSAMLYGSLMEAYTFMKGEPDVLQNYAQRFTEAVQSLKLFGEAKEVSDYYRTGQVVREKQ